MKQIRKASAADIALIQSLAQQSWHQAYHGIISTDQIDYMLGTMYAGTELRRHFENANYHYYIIEHEKPAGFLGFEHHYEPHTTKLHRIYLLPEAQGAGLGKFAIEFLKQKTVEAADHRIILNVNKMNKARQVYESQGFKIYDEVVLPIGGGYVMDDFLMEFHL